MSELTLAFGAVSIIVVAIAGLVVVAFAWWLTDRLCAPGGFLRMVDHPNERSLHRTPIPRTGGLAIIASVVIGLVAAYVVVALLRPSMPVLPKGLASGSLWIVVSMLLVCIVSFMDDRIGLSAGLRFIVQIAAAVIVVGGVGLKLSSIPIPMVGAIPLGWMAGPLSALFLVWMANLYNFMDGMDGFAGGMTVFGFGFLAFFGWHAEHPFMSLIATLVAASALGFLIHNFPPARIFMGDVGSITLGFLAGTLVLLGLRDKLFDIWVPVLIFSPFIVDATATLIRRAVGRQRVWEAHREHFYQRLVLSGWGHQRTVSAEYAVMTVCGLMAVAYQYASEPWKLGLLMVWATLFFGLAYAVGLVEERRPVNMELQEPRT